MLIFQQEDTAIKVYACTLPQTAHLANARIAVKAMLKEAYGTDVEISHHKNGAPFLPGKNEDITVTHCNGLAVIAITSGNCKIGIDAETERRAEQLLRIAPRFLSAEQLKQWSESPHSLLRAWTIKEAIYKAAHTPGLPLAEITLPADYAAFEKDKVACVRINKCSFRLQPIELPHFNGLITLAINFFEEV